MTRSLESQFQRYRTRGDVAALADVFDRTAPEVLRIAQHFAPSPADAEELLQETFLTAIRSAEGFDAQRRLVPWLLGILHNHARNAARRARRQLGPQAEAGSALADAATDAEPSELPQVVARALGTLEEPYRAVLVLHLTHGLSAAAIADVLGRPPATVRSQLARGLKQVRGRLPKSTALPAVAAVPLGSGLASVRQVVVTEAQALALTAPAVGAAALILGGLIVTKKMAVIGVAALALCAVGVGAAFEFGYLGGGDDTESARESVLTVEPALEGDPALRARGSTEDPVRADAPAPRATSASGSMGAAAKRVPLDAPIPEGKGSVAGRLILADGTPLVGVQVALWGSSPITDVTDKSGAFHLHGEWVANRQVYIRGANEFDAVMLKAVEMKVNERVHVEIVVDTGYEFSGTLRTAEGDKSIVNNLIVLRRPGASADDETQAGYASAHTDADGRFHFSYLPRGRYSLVVEEEGYVTQRHRIEIAQGVRDLDVRLAQARPWIVRWTGLPPGAAGTTILWRAYRQDPGVSIGGGGKAVINEQGEMPLLAPAAGKYQLIFFASKFTQRIEQIVDIPAGALDPLEITVEPRVRLTGRLLDANRKPLPKTQLIIGNARDTHTDAEGRFEIGTLLKTGSHLVWAYVGRSGVRLPDLDLKQNGPSEVELVMPGTASFKARIVADETRYLSGWLMQPGAQPPQVGYLRLEQDGTIALAHIAAGKYQVQLSLPGCQSVNRTIELTAGQSLDLGELTFVRYPLVPVKFILPEGAKAPDPMWVRISVRETGTEPKSGDGPSLRREKGKLVLFGLVPGRYDLTFRPPDFEPIERHVTVVAGENPVLELDLRKP